jgi:lysophospholipase L1-like esterase
MNRRFLPQLVSLPLVSLRLLSLPVLLVCSIVLLSMVAAMAQVQPDLPPGVSAQPITASGAPALRAKRINMVLTGDSTVTDETGWAKGFAGCLTPDVALTNLSRGGRSSKSFIAEGRWKEALDRKPDYVLIQFGHNDQPGHGADRETDPETTYRQYMNQYVDDARAAGIKPVLVTSLSRRQWGDDGKIHSTLEPNVKVVKQIAAEKHVPLVDLHARSIELYEKLGKEACNDLSPKKTDGTIDNTHLNAKGSQTIGPLVADELKKAVPELAPYIKSQ